MPRGGYRVGAGGKSTWKHGKTMTIRVPKALVNEVKEITKRLDDSENINLESGSKEYSGSVTGFYKRDDLNIIADSILADISVTLNGKDRDAVKRGLEAMIERLCLNHNQPSLNSKNLEIDAEMTRKIGIEGLYYITHVNNIISILRRGILSHSNIAKGNVEFTPIYDDAIINNRQTRQVAGNKILWDFANLYFQPRNAMLYRVLREKTPNEIAILFISSSILNRKDIFITNGNAASLASDILSSDESRGVISKIRDQIDNEWWTDSDGSKRKMMAECLVPDSISPDLIRGIYVGSDKAKNNLENLILQSISSGVRQVPITVEPNNFFQPSWRASITPNLSIARGDMFFSRMQTLTISVNCVGVMGKGLASTAKYRFPDVYVKYQDLCKSRALKMEVPYVHKRESSIFNELADDVSGAEEQESQTWFLLFPTKDHWRNKADTDGIEKGLQWLCNNYKKKGIQSLAMPALGCGLGQLEWKDIGPLMCKYLTTMDIVTVIYLPADKEVPGEFLSKAFLLSQHN